MKNPLILLLLATAFLTSNCITNQEDLTGNVTVDPMTVSYADDVQTIFNQSCGGANCHINNSQNGVNLTNYTATLNSVGTNYGEAIVIPNDPDNSPLVDKIEPNPDIGSRMPLGRGPLSPEDISIIRAWIEGGAENN